MNKQLVITIVYIVSTIIDTVVATRTLYNKCNQAKQKGSINIYRYETSIGQCVDIKPIGTGIINNVLSVKNIDGERISGGLNALQNLTPHQIYQQYGCQARCVINGVYNHLVIIPRKDIELALGFYDEFTPIELEPLMIPPDPRPKNTKRHRHPNHYGSPPRRRKRNSQQKGMKNFEFLKASQEGDHGDGPKTPQTKVRPLIKFDDTLI